MVLMSGIPIIDNPPGDGDTREPFWWRDSRTIAFRDMDGTDLLPFRGYEFISRKGATGLDLLPREVSQLRHPGMDGSMIDDIAINAREIFLPIFLGSDESHRIYLQRRQEMATRFNYRLHDYRRTGGTFDLVANSHTGERAIRCLYVSGMDGDTSADAAGVYWESLGLNLLCAQPYWRGQDWSTPIIVRPANVGWMSGSNYQMEWPGQLSSSRALGSDLPIEIAGDAESWPVIEMVGPAQAIEITAGSLRVTIPNGLAEDEHALLITDPRDRDVQFSGVRDWSRVGPYDFYSALQPGTAIINVAMSGASLTTRARIYGPTNYELPW